MADRLADHDPPHAMQLGSMLRGEGVKGQSKSPPILVGVGWNGVEWVWRGYNFGYKTPILGFLGKTGFPQLILVGLGVLLFLYSLVLLKE